MRAEEALTLRSTNPSPISSRVFLLVLDSVGVGAAPDAADYGDEGSNTMGHIDEAVGGLELEHLGRLGIGNVVDLAGTPPAATPLGAFGTMAEASAGKDSVTGHWELAGVILDRPFPTFPHGFPHEVIAGFERRIGRGSLGNVAGSGTEIIEALGEESRISGRPIVYTSADSVFQVAAHVESVPVAQLHDWCAKARAMLTGDVEVGRVIARPFAGSAGAFFRTPDRRDYAVLPPAPTVLDAARAAGLPTTAVGKVGDLFSGRGIGRDLPAKGNEACLAALASLILEEPDPAGSLVFANLVDFDTLFGHRNDPAGYAGALLEFDAGLGGLLEALRPGDVLFVTADHGNDPTTPSTDHSRELVPILAVGDRVPAGLDVGRRQTFADVAATIARLLSLSLSLEPPVGTAFL
ncbi:MAG: phosphopentomutase [Actinomycetota bacterium]|nr:phosphopentomutase [Actinomycetota bacterium]